MIDKGIMEKLMSLTQEEQAMLDEGGYIDISKYTNNDDNVISAKKMLVDGNQITIRKQARFAHFPEHTRDFIEMVYMCSGKTTHIINGQKVELSEGEILFLSQSARQEILPASINDIAVNFIILPQFLYKTLEMIGEEETPLKRFLIEAVFKERNSLSFIHFKVSDILTIQNLIENLMWMLIGEMPNNRNINQTTMGLLFMELLNHTDKLLYKTKKIPALEIFKYIEENYKDGSLSEAAKLLHYDFYWLSHEIKNKTGKTYTDLLQDKRLSVAADLLKNTKLGIEEVSKAVGYNNKSYFHRIFNKKYGMSPKKYRDK